MARYVLLEFEDNAKAKKFVERVNGSYEAVESRANGIRARAVWAIPTKFCECTRGLRRSFPFTRGRKSGWWIHVECGRPTRAWSSGNHWFDSIGRNLLPGNTDLIPEGLGVAANPDRTGATINPVGEFLTDRGQVKAERRRNRKRTPHPRRG